MAETTEVVKSEPEKKEDVVRKKSTDAAGPVSVSYRRVQYASIAATCGQCYR